MRPNRASDCNQWADEGAGGPSMVDADGNERSGRAHRTLASVFGKAESPGSSKSLRGRSRPRDSGGVTNDSASAGRVVVKAVVGAEEHAGRDVHEAGPEAEEKRREAVRAAAIPLSSTPSNPVSPGLSSPSSAAGAVHGAGAGCDPRARDPRGSLNAGHMGLLAHVSLEDTQHKVIEAREKFRRKLFAEIGADSRILLMELPETKRYRNFGTEEAYVEHLADFVGEHPRVLLIKGSGNEMISNLNLNLE